VESSINQKHYSLNELISFESFLVNFSWKDFINEFTGTGDSMTALDKNITLICIKSELIEYSSLEALPMNVMITW
jgi:hypothetical protein